MTARTFSSADLQNAIERGEVVPYFQPIVELRSGELWGFEMLARWLHPQLGMIPPNQFIPLVESSGLMDAVCDSVTKQACEALMPDFPAHLSLSVNVAPTQMRDRSLAGRILSWMESAGFPPTQLIVEITETVLFRDFKVAEAVANDLKEQGVRLALDDFGTGYSSLSYLNSLPLDEIKIDRSFIHSINERRESRKIAAAVAGLGHSLGLMVVAEGVEENIQADACFYLGCELAQGYLYSRPVPAADVAAMIAKPALSSPPKSPLLSKDMAAHLEVSPALRMAHLMAIYDSAPMGLCFLDKDLRFVSINERFGEMAPALEPRLGRTIEDVQPLIYSKIGSYLRLAQTGERIYNVEVLNPIFPNRTMSMCCEPVRDEAHEIVGVCVTLKDTTKYKKLEEALLEHKEHYQLPLDLNSTYPFTADPEGKISWAQARGSDTLRMHEARGMGWLRAVHPADVSWVAESWAVNVRAGTQYEMEFRMRSVDRRGWRWMRARTSPQRGEHGEILGWYGLLEDINDRKPASAPPD
ncbi:EAL domain-containing protein [Acidobacterium sp. S8]|uniref:sensor domain-containing phosphodiesterase n=1 Tax=Acidobacterium sp. S8 TaxID=1641854 RepID=UPI00131AA50A|nr:EAL domain-containing protein [Acidobacterium sp. S8]